MIFSSKFLCLLLAAPFASGFSPSALPRPSVVSTPSWLRATEESKKDSAIGDVVPKIEKDINVGAGFEAAMEEASKQLSSLGRKDPVVDYNAVAQDIVEMIVNSKESPQDWGPDRKSVGPTLIRLAWHSSGTYAKVPPNKPPAGGSQKGTMRFEKEQKDPHNNGLTETAIRWMGMIHDKHPGLSHGDLYTLAGVVAVKSLGGPTIPWGYGRKDGPERDVPPNDRLPNASTPPNSPASPEDAAHLRQIFGRMGFNDQEIVVLSGAHAVGRCHKEFSGFEGPWTFTETRFGNAYFRMLNVPRFFWTVRRWDGPTQYRLAFSRGSSVMMLPSDMILKEDPVFNEYVKKYARDEKAFLEDFATTFSKLLALGTKDLTYIDLDYDANPGRRRRRRN